MAIPQNEIGQNTWQFLCSWVLGTFFCRILIRLTRCIWLSLKPAIRSLHATLTMRSSSVSFCEGTFFIFPVVLKRNQKDTHSPILSRWPWSLLFVPSCHSPDWIPHTQGSVNSRRLRGGDVLRLRETTGSVGWRSC